ncbi:brv1, partial [Drosophila busckii]
ERTVDAITFVITFLIISANAALICIYSGFDHETQSFKNILITIFIVLFFQLTIADPIKFIIISIDKACWPEPMPRERPLKKKDSKDNDRIEFLKQRLQSFKFQLLITERYRNTALNESYKQIAQDLFLFFKFFFVLFFLLLSTRNELTYHNNQNLRELLTNNHSDYMGINHVVHLNQIFDFVESSLVDTFNYYKTEDRIYSWVHSEQTKMIGVVRLRQLRFLFEDYDFRDPQFDDKLYMPGWALPYRRLHYEDKYWRIYDPWKPINGRHDFVDSVVMNFNHDGKLHYYPELEGYVSLLAVTKANSMKILDYLTEYTWLNYNTSAIFMDFSLFNMDANIISICTLRLEQTPYGSVIPDVDCDSIDMLLELDQESYTNLLVKLIYIIVVVQFSQALFITLWYDRSKIRSMWIKMDLIIFALNFLVIVCVILQSALLSSMSKRLEGSNKLDFVDFRRPARLNALNNILYGFLICITTLRIWKILQFSNLFKIFTRTLYLAWKPLAITGIIIFITLMSFSIVAATINGNNSENFVRPFQSIISLMCFSFGFTSEITPDELFHGGKYLGIFLYAMMGFVLSILLTNVFMTLINDYFTTARATRDAAVKNQISFFQFMRVEYYDFCNFFLNIFRPRKVYKRNNRTVAENIELLLSKNKAEPLSIKYRVGRTLFMGFNAGKEEQRVKDEETQQLEYRERIEHMKTVQLILNTQMEIMERLLFTDKDDN